MFVVVAERGEWVIRVNAAATVCTVWGFFLGRLLFVEGEAVGKATSSAGRGDIEGRRWWWDEWDWLVRL